MNQSESLLDKEVDDEEEESLELQEVVIDKQPQVIKGYSVTCACM